MSSRKAAKTDGDQVLFKNSSDQKNFYSWIQVSGFGHRTLSNRVLNFIYQVDHFAKTITDCVQRRPHWLISSWQRFLKNNFLLRKQWKNVETIMWLKRLDFHQRGFKSNLSREIFFNLSRDLRSPSFLFPHLKKVPGNNFQGKKIHIFFSLEA